MRARFFPVLFSLLVMAQGFKLSLTVYAQDLGILILESPEDRSRQTTLQPLFRWSDTGRANRHRLQVATTQDFKDPLVLDLPVSVPSGDTSTAPNLKVESSVRAEYRIDSGKLKPGSTYYWRVVAERDTPEGVKRRTAEDSPLQFMTVASANKNFEEPRTRVRDKDVLEKLRASGLSLGRTFLDANVADLDARQPATVSFLKTAGAGTVFTTEFGLLYTPPSALLRYGNTFLYFVPSIEGSLTSDESDAPDALRSRIAFRLDGDCCLGLDGMSAYLNLKHEADQQFNYQDLTAELLFEPIKLRAGIGMYRPLFGNPNNAPLYYRLEPFLGVDGGRNIERGASRETERSVLRLLARARALLLVKHFLIARDVVFFLDDMFYHLPLQRGEDAFNYLVLGAEFPVSDNISFLLTYRVGEASPKFEKIETIGGSLGFKF